jgi:hypothetical protein
LFETLDRDRSNAFMRSPPIFPLPILNGQAPVLLVFDPQDPGVEIAYERNFAADSALVRSATRETTRYGIPSLLPVFIVSEGKIVYAREHVDGFAVLIEHAGGWASYYRRLEHMFVLPTERSRRESKVRAGDIIGYVGPTGAGPLQPLRFELWRGNEEQDYEPVDPIRFMRRWRLERWSDEGARPKPVSLVV